MYYLKHTLSSEFPFLGDTHVTPSLSALRCLEQERLLPYLHKSKPAQYPISQLQKGTTKIYQVYKIRYITSSTETLKTLGII